MPGLFERFGSFARNLFKTAQDLGLPISDLFDIAEIADVDVSPADVVKEWGRVRTQTELESTVSAWPEDDLLPKGLYTQRRMSGGYRYGYAVRFYGRDKQGRFSSQEYYVAFSEKVEPGTAIELAEERFGVGGEYEGFMDVFDASVVGAYWREGDVWEGGWQ